MSDDDVIAQFWRLFAEKAPALAAADSADSPVYDELLEALQRVDTGLFLEFCVDPEVCELIVTPEGERALFARAKQVVAAAPPVVGWTICALKPRLGFPETVRWESLTLRIEDMAFDPLRREGSADLGLRVYIAGIGAADVDHARNAVLRVIDHGLGEERHAEVIQHVEVRPAATRAALADFIPLADLDAFVRQGAA